MATAAVAAASVVAASRARHSRRRMVRAQARKPRQADPPMKEFEMLKLGGPAARWLFEQQQACGGKFLPTPIQAASMRPIINGSSVALQAPTGTGKTLAYMLPLWKRLGLDAKLVEPGLRMVVIIPFEDLMFQVGGVAASLAGNDDSIFVLRPNQEISTERLAKANVVIGTPSVFLKLHEQPELERQWLECLEGLETVVIDEADCLLPPGGAKTWELGELLEHFYRATMHRGGQYQVVIASASIDAQTLELLEDGTGLFLNLVSAGALSDEELNVKKSALRMVTDPKSGALRLRTMPRPSTLAPNVELPEGLTHKVSIEDKLMSRDGSINAELAIEPIAEAIWTLSPRRCLVLLAERRPPTERGRSLGKYLKRMRSRLSPLGFQVVTVSATVQLTHLPGSYVDPDDSAGAEGDKPLVIVGRTESIRGLDLAGLDAVVIVGSLSTAREYLHMAGRTGRFEPGRRNPTNGTVISLMTKPDAKTLKRWGQELGFVLEPIRFQPVPVKPSVRFRLGTYNYN